MKNRNQILLFFILLAFCMGCKCKEAISPEDKLPPATQIGANTFGFLENGDVWLPKGFSGTKNPSWYYDPTYGGGDFSISAYKYENENNKQTIIVGSRNMSHTGKYVINNTSDAGITFYSMVENCEIYTRDSLIYCTGDLTITRLDTSIGIISGTFWATLYNPLCKDTIKITEGRFDLKGN